MNALIYIIAMTLVGVICYFIGLRRGIKVTEENHANDYDDGYNDGLSYCQQNYEMHELEPMLDTLYNKAYEDRCEKGKELIRQLDEDFYEMHLLEPMLDTLYDKAYKERCEKGKELIRQLDELFEDDDENNKGTDCGNY